MGNKKKRYGKQKKGVWETENISFIYNFMLGILENITGVFGKIPHLSPSSIGEGVEINDY